ncbi:M56 family metallopeptidase [Zobellia uliginosa]|uniref:M56 family metallopeptidase n=1 Tax=Zobellia uliginosa TaxID=143224 RepID=UPI001C06E87A|nr:M56 family metallopeptidase [Zobellia uliginosa]MBU2947737.1 M56 family metallopeptidase [Zobellia uliginosa]
MVQYVLECIAFQLVFLVIYDFFLKRETFFQWNRFYLLSTFLLSLVLPLIKIEAFKTKVDQSYIEYQEYLWELNNAVVVSSQEDSGFDVSWQILVFAVGVGVALILFALKLRQLNLLKSKGEKLNFKEFTRIMVSDSTIAFSFFKSVFIGDKVPKSDYKSIIAHELVHIKQGHSWDLLFFELMRIIGWFNPLVYVYQNRISELHEFIADAKVAKSNKNEQYQLLLSQVFQTQNISFINHFFKSSLIKKRIVMLQKSQSKSVFKLKYLALVPLVLGMLFYTSCEQNVNSGESSENSNSLEERLINLNQELMSKDSLTENELQEILKMTNVVASQANKNAKTVNGWTVTTGVNADYEGVAVPFAVVEQVPVFPGCENATDQRACFQKSMQKHIGEYFKYPEEAQEQGIQGRVNVLFTIDSTGNIANVRTRGPHKLLENEVVNIIARLPQMKPGTQKGKVVSVPFSIPITFKLR